MRRCVWLLLVLLVFTGCATEKINWQERIGNYTYDQAVMEFGPPDKLAKLDNGTTVGDWLLRGGQVIVAPEPYFVPPGCYFGSATPMYSQTTVPPLFLRLAFDADGKLFSEKQVTR